MLRTIFGWHKRDELSGLDVSDKSFFLVVAGEVVAFIIGWNLILEYAIGTASVARGYSGYLDSLLNKSMEHAFRNAMPINVSLVQI